MRLHRRIVDSIVQTARLAPFFGLTHYEVTYIDDVTQFAYFARGLRAFEQFFGFFIEDVKSVPGAIKPEIAAHYANI